MSSFGGQALLLAGTAVGVELDALSGEAAPQVSAPVIDVEHSLGRNAAIGVQDPVGGGQLDLAAGQEVRDLVRRGVREFGEVIVGSPRAGLDQLQRGGDELLHFAQRLACACLRR